MHALERIHQVLVEGGLLLDLHPVPPPATAEAQGRSLGEFDEREFLQVVATTEAALQEVVDQGLFAFERGLAFDVLERFDDGPELLETVAGWEGFRVPSALHQRIRLAASPIDIRERVILRRFRAL